MFARVIQADVDSGKIDAGIKGLEEALRESIVNLEGYEGSFLLIDRTSNKAIYMTLYDTRENADAVVGSGFTHDLISKMSDVIVGDYIMGGYEVALKA